jgi:MFS family permease
MGLADMSRIWHWSSTFGALRNRDFRWLWVGRLASSATFEMSGVAQGWLVYELTGSALALGWVGSGWSVATLLLSLYGGVLCDRANKRTVLLWTRSAMGLNALIVGLLISFRAIRVWHLAASSLLTGVLFAFLMPAQQSIIADLMDSRTLLNAMALDAIGMGLMGIFCASLAGVMIETVGAQSVYYAMAAFYGLALFSSSRLRYAGRRSTATGSVWHDAKEGLYALLHSSALMGIMVLTLVRVLLAMPYRTLMPKYSEEVLGFGATGLGLLLSMPGLGATAGSLAVASMGDFRGKGKLFLASGTMMGLCLVFFSAARSLPLIFALLVLVGAAGNICMVANTTLLQANTAAAVRGRVMSIYLMLWGLTPLGTLPAGAIADRVGVPVVVASQGVLVMLAFAAMFCARQGVRRMD